MDDVPDLRVRLPMQKPCDVCGAVMERKRFGRRLGEAAARPGIAMHCADGYEGTLRAYRAALAAVRAHPDYKGEG